MRRRCPIVRTVQPGGSPHDAARPRLAPTTEASVGAATGDPMAVTGTGRRVSQVDTEDEALLAVTIVPMPSVHRPVGARVRVALSGELCEMTTSLLVGAVAHAASQGAVEVVVDLSRVTLCTAGGVAALQAARAEFDGCGGALALQGATGIVARVLDICGVETGSPLDPAPPGVHPLAHATTVTSPRLPRRGPLDERSAEALLAMSRQFVSRTSVRDVLRRCATRPDASCRRPPTWGS